MNKLWAWSWLVDTFTRSYIRRLTFKYVANASSSRSSWWWLTCSSSICLINDWVLSFERIISQPKLKNTSTDLEPYNRDSIDIFKTRNDIPLLPSSAFYTNFVTKFCVLNVFHRPNYCFPPLFSWWITHLALFQWQWLTTMKFSITNNHCQQANNHHYHLPKFLSSSLYT